VLGQSLRVRWRTTIRTFNTRAGATITLVGDDLRAPAVGRERRQ
jgi:hypothetical protein